MADPLATYNATVKVTGTSTAFTGEAMALVSGKIYQTTDTTKRIWDPAVTPTIYDNAVPVAAADFTLEYLTGTVTFDPSYSPTTPITADGSYLPTHAVVLAREWEYEARAELLDVTVFAAPGVRTRLPGLLDASGSISTLDTLETDLDSGGGEIKLRTVMSGRTAIILELGMPDGALNVFRIHIGSEDWSNVVDGILTSTVNWELAATTALDGTIVGFVIV